MGALSFSFKMSSLVAGIIIGTVADELTASVIKNIKKEEERFNLKKKFSVYSNPLIVDGVFEPIIESSPILEIEHKIKSEPSTEKRIPKFKSEFRLRHIPQSIDKISYDKFLNEKLENDTSDSFEDWQLDLAINNLMIDEGIDEDNNYSNEYVIGTDCICNQNNEFIPLSF